MVEHHTGILEEVNREGIMLDNPQTRLTFRASPPHSPNVGEGKFCELRLYGVLGSSANLAVLLP